MGVPKMVALALGSPHLEFAKKGCCRQEGPEKGVC